MTTKTTPSGKPATVKKTAPAKPVASAKPAVEKPAIKMAPDAIFEATSKTTSKAKIVTRKSVPAASTKRELDLHELQSMIATAAYFRAEKRSFEVGFEQEDWLMAEQEISRMLSS